MVVELLAIGLVELAPPEPDEERSQRSDWADPAVKLTPDDPFPTTSTIHEPLLGTNTVVEIVLAKAALLTAVALGADWVTPLRETDPAVAVEIDPAKETRT